MRQTEKILFFDYLPGVNYQYASGAGLGSSLFKLAAMADASEQGCEVHLLTSEIKKNLLEGAQGVDYICTDPQELNLDWFDMVVNLGLPEEEVPENLKLLKHYQAFTEAHKKKYKTEPHLRLWRSLVAGALCYEVPALTSRINLSLNPASIEKAAKLLPGEYTWIALPCQTVSLLKNYHQWDKVIELLLAAGPKVKILLLGDHEENFYRHEKVLNLTGKTDMQLLKALISHVDILVGVDGLATNLAMVLNTKLVALFSMISPENVIYDLKSPEKVSLVAGNCPYQFCYKDIVNYRNSGCRYLSENPNTEIPECLNFSPETIVEAVIGSLRK